LGIFVLAKLEIEQKLQGEKELQPVEEYNEKTPKNKIVIIENLPGPIVGVVKAKNILQFSVDSVNYRSEEIRHKQDRENPYQLPLVKLNSLNTIIEMPKLQAVDYTD
jgi:hypothetical protein